MPTPPDLKDGRGFLAGGGELGRLMRELDWSASPAGPPEAWPEVLRSAVSICLASSVPIIIWAGTRHDRIVQLYNDAYRPVMGTDRHPSGLGQLGCRNWPEIWHIMGPIFEDVLTRGHAVRREDQPMVVHRNGFPEQTWFTHAHSPIRDADGRIVGVFTVVTETTVQMLAEERRREADRAAAASESHAKASEERLHLALQAAELSTWELDLVTDQSRRSLQHDRMFGFETLQAEWGEAVTRRHVLEEDLPIFDAGMARARETGTLQFEFRVRHPDGSIHWIAPYGRTEYASDGTPRRMVGVVQDVTARKEAEAEVARSNALFRAIFESDLMGLAIYDAWADRVLTANDMFLHMVGESRADFAQGNYDWRLITPAEYLPRDEAAIRQARQEGSWRPYEKEYRRLDGSRIAVRISSAPLSGLPGHVVISLEDISASRAAEEGLRRSEHRLQLAKQAAGIGVWDWDLRTGEIDWSPEMFIVLGIDPATPPGQLFSAWEKVLHPADREETIAIARAGASAGKAFSTDFRIVARDGEIRWIRTQAIALNDVDGRPVRLTGINIDVTAQRRLESELRQNADKLAAEVVERRRERDRIFELSNELFAVIGYDGVLKSVNPAFVRLMGVREDELLAHPYVSFVHPEDRPETTATMASFRRDGSLQHFEHRLVSHDGQAFWTRWSAVPDNDHAYAVGRDVTREREQEEALRQAQKMEAVGQLTGGIAHDFNNLLGAMVGAFDLIRRKPDDLARVKRFAELGLQAADRGARLTGQLLTFSRTQRLEPKRVLPSHLIEDMEDLLKRTLGPMITVTLAFDEPRLPVTSDQTQLELAVLNLAINARDAMPDGGELTIATSTMRVDRDAELEPGEYVVLAIADTGHGMPKEVLARAFDPFFTTKGVGAGTGLGLSQVYGFARQLGGTARIESEVGKGTTVRIYMPRAEGPAEDEAPAKATVDGPMQPASVLLVDDDAEMREVLASSLESLGHRVVAARNGEQGLDLLEATRPDLLIVDYAMPGLTGVDVAERARRLHPDLPILFVSGYAETERLERIAGPDGPILRKPYRLEELRSALSSVLVPQG